MPSRQGAPQGADDRLAFASAPAGPWPSLPGVGRVLGELLPLAVAIAISPIPIITVILMLFTPQARTASLAFLGGWLAGILGVAVVALIVVGTAGAGTTSTPSAPVSWIKVLLGLVLVGLAVREWRHRTPSGVAAPRPKWMATPDQLIPREASVLGVGLAALNPKNLPIGLAAGVAIAQGGLSIVDDIWVLLLFTVVAGSTVLVPVAAYEAASGSMRPRLERLREWLEANNATVMSVLLLVIGTVLIGRGL